MRSKTMDRESLGGTNQWRVYNLCGFWLRGCLLGVVLQDRTSKLFGRNVCCGHPVV